jgi:hypothetical protein
MNIQISLSIEEFISIYRVVYKSYEHSKSDETLKQVEMLSDIYAQMIADEKIGPYIEELKKAAEQVDKSKLN